MTKTCVDQLLNLRVQADLVIVDNHSEDASFASLRKRYADIPNVLVIETEKNGGYSYGNNAGIRAAERISPRRFLAIMNPDVYLTANIFPKLQKKLESDSRCAAISGRMLLPGKTWENSEHPTVWRIPTAREVYLDHLRRRRSWDGRKTFIRVDERYVRTELLPGSFFLIKKEVFQKVGWFDEGEFLYNEENILGIKLKRLHYYCMIDTKVTYEHRHETGYGHSSLYNYQHNIKRILKTNEISFRSREYLCRNYYHGRYLERLYSVHRINTLVIYLKYMAAYAIGLFYKPEN